MTEAELEILVTAMRRHQVRKLEVKIGKKAYAMTLGTGPAGPARPAPQAKTRPAPSPAIGTLCPRGGADGLPPLGQGARVEAGEVLGYIRSGAVLHVIAAPVAGVLTEAPPPEGQILGFGDPVVSMVEELR